MYENKGSQFCAPPMKPLSVAQEVLNQAIEVVDFSQKIVEKAMSTLGPIMGPASNPSEIKKNPIREYPPFFEDLRERLATIQNNLNQIEETLSRVEL